MKKAAKIQTEVVRFRRALLGMAIAVGLGSASGAYALTEIDLVNGDSGTSNGAIYNWVDQQSTGTGVIEPFLRVQSSGSGADMEQGYNTEAGTPWDTKAGLWTHDLQKSDLVSKVIDGTTYYEFLLDINQIKGGDGEFLSLNNVQIFSSATPAGADESLAGFGVALFDMDVGADGDTTVELDFTRNPGSGSGDMLMYVPVSLFAGVADDDYIIFYTLFGDPNNANDGFEEWALITGEQPPPSVPDAGTTAVLLGLAIAGMGALRRKLS